MATIRQKLETYAITILTHQRRRIVQRTANAELMIETLFRYRDQGRFALHAFVIMPDHLHVLITPAVGHHDCQRPSTHQRRLLLRSSQAIPRRDLAHGYHEHRIRDLQDFESQGLYLANNPKRKKYSDYPYVHTAYKDRLDVIPTHLKIDAPCS